MQPQTQGKSWDCLIIAKQSILEGRQYKQRDPIRQAKTLWVYQTLGHCWNAVMREQDNLGSEDRGTQPKYTRGGEIKRHYRWWHWWQWTLLHWLHIDDMDLWRDLGISLKETGLITIDNGNSPTNQGANLTRRGRSLVNSHTLWPATYVESGLLLGSALFLDAADIFNMSGLGPDASTMTNHGRSSTIRNLLFQSQEQWRLVTVDTVELQQASRSTLESIVTYFTQSKALAQEVGFWETMHLRPSSNSWFARSVGPLVLGF